MVEKQYLKQTFNKTMKVRVKHFRNNKYCIQYKRYWLESYITLEIVLDIMGGGVWNPYLGSASQCETYAKTLKTQADIDKHYVEEKRKEQEYLNKYQPYQIKQIY